MSWTKEKEKEYNKTNYAKHREKYLLQKREHYLQNKEKFKQRNFKNKDRRRNNALQKQYGITLEKYNEMHKGQNGLCAICNKSESFKMIDGSIRTLAVDHNHITNEVRGLLCCNCNLAIGYFNESAEALESAAKYIRSYESEK